MIKIHINPLIIPVILAVYMWGNIFFFLMSFLCLCMHELIHLFFLCKNHILVESISIEPFGISIKTNNPKIILPSVFLSAPFFNILLAVFLHIISKKIYLDILYSFFISNLFIGLFNLLPILPFDGGRAIEAYFMKKNKETTGFLNTLSIISGIIILFFGIILLKATEYNFSICLIGIFIIFNAICENENFKMRKEKNLIRKADYDKKMKNIKNLCVPYDYPAHKLISKFKGDDYYIVNIIKNGVITRTVTETQIIDSIINSRQNIQICDVY